MVYRAEVFGELCATCKERATSMCLRCGRPLCDPHSLPDDRRCAECEQQYFNLVVRTRNPLRQWGATSRGLVKIAKWSAIVGGSGVACVFVFPPALVFSPALLVALGAAIALPFARAAERSRDRILEDLGRRRFLAERRHPELPPAPADPALEGA